MSTIDRNADNCEAARELRCICSCGGALHGRRHSVAWRKAALKKAQAAQAARVHQLTGMFQHTTTPAGNPTDGRYCTLCRQVVPRARWEGRCPAFGP